MSSDGLALAAAGAAAAGLMWCMNSKRTAAPYSEPSVCASARRAASAPANNAASARLAGDGTAIESDVYKGDLWSMSSDGAEATKDMGGGGRNIGSAELTKKINSVRSSTAVESSMAKSVGVEPLQVGRAPTQSAGSAEKTLDLMPFNAPSHLG